MIEAPHSYTRSGRRRSDRAISKNLRTRERIVDATASVIAREGYAGCTIARVTAAAEIAHGTFYLYFESQEQLFDQMLLETHKRMRGIVGRAIRGATTIAEVEDRGLRANFNFLRRHPDYFRVWAEAEVFAPKAYAEYVDTVIRSYARLLAAIFPPDETVEQVSLEQYAAVASMLYGARSSLVRRYGVKRQRFVGVPEFAMKTYIEFVVAGIPAVLAQAAAQERRPG